MYLSCETLGHIAVYVEGLVYLGLSSKSCSSVRNHAS